MNDVPHSDDELLSSLLDGELTAEERSRLDERLRDDPDLRRRRDEIRAAAALAATPVAPLSAVDSDRLIGAALAVSEHGGTTATNVTDLAAAADRRRARTTRIAAVAAGVVALALTVPALRSIDGGDDADTAAVSAETDDTDADDEAFDGSLDAGGDDALGNLAADSPTDDDMADMAEADMADDSTSDDATGMATEDVGAATFRADAAALFTPTASFDPLADDVGEFPGPAALITAVGDEWRAYAASRPTTTTAPLEPGVDDADDGDAELARDDFLATARTRFDELSVEPCADIVDVIVGFFATETIVAADYATARVDGEDVIVGVFLRPDDTARVLVIDPVTCALTDESLEEGPPPP